MKKIYLLLSAIFIVVTAVIAQPGTLDVTYGTNGVLLLDPAGTDATQPDNIHDVIASPDGSSFACGGSKINDVNTGTLYHILANGAPDMNFGTNGMITLIFGLETYCYDIALQPDGKIVISGTTYVDYNYWQSEMFAARFNTDGTPDLTFNGTGRFITAYSIATEDCQALAIQPDGKIVLAGETKINSWSDAFFCRLNSNGSIDNTFGIAGYSRYSVWNRADIVKGIAILSNGDILAAGGYITTAVIERGFIMKLKPSGVIDANFGNEGVVIPYNTTTYFWGLAVKGNYMYLTGKVTTSGSNTDIFTCKLDLDGNLDPSFDSDGMTNLNINGNDFENGMDIQLQPDNKIVISGMTGSSATADRNIALVRYNTNGQLDLTFGTGGTGYTETSLGALWEEAVNFNFQPDGKILTCGLTAQQPINIEGFIARYQNDPFITFNVDMSTAHNFTPGVDQVYLAGDFPGASWITPGDAGSLKMSQVETNLYSISLMLPAGTYQYKYFKNAGWTGAEYTNGNNRSCSVSSGSVINNLWGGDVITWANLQWPGGSNTINSGDVYNVYAQAFINEGVTGVSGGAIGLQAWIGYSTGNTNPDTWTNWVPAPLNTGHSGDNNDEFTANLAAGLPEGTYYYASRFRLKSGAYVYGGFNGGFWDGTTNVSGELTVNALSTKTLNLKFFLEGLYAGSSTMNKAQDENGIHFPGNIADEVTIELHKGTSYSEIISSFSNVSVDINGLASLNNLPNTLNSDYYITVKHRNSIETTSSGPVSFAGNSISCDFSTAASQAYGSNQMNIGGVYVIYGGDVSYDGSVDIGDMTPVDNAASNFISGYLDSDVNGDGTIDIADMTIIDNNGAAFVRSITP